MDKKILCKCCGSEIASESNGKIIFNNMKAISILEASIIDNSKDVKCRGCGNWNSFDINNVQTINHSRKSKDVFFGYERNISKFRGNSKDR
jgi:ribosomal protein S27E